MIHLLFPVNRRHSGGPASAKPPPLLLCHAPASARNPSAGHQVVRLLSASEAIVVQMMFVRIVQAPGGGLFGFG